MGGSRTWAIAAGLLALSVAALGGIAGSKAAGGADSYGYISQADLFLEGRLVEPAPWIGQVPWPGAQHAFTPLGWVPRRSESVIVPQYAPGLPLLMALAKLVAGHCAVFWVSPIAGGLVVLLTFSIGRRLVSPGVGLAAAWLVAASPVFLFMVLSPMSDVPVTAAWLLVYWAVARGTGPGSMTAGAAAALAVLIRPNLAPVAAPVALWLAYDVWRTEPPRRLAAAWRLGLFVLACAAGAAAVAYVNTVRYGSPLKSGYEPMALLYASANIVPNAGRYLGWFVETQTAIPLAGLIALVLPLRRIWPAPGQMGLVLSSLGMVVFVCLQYFAYAEFEEWPFLRFFLPCWPIVMIGCAAAFRPFARLAGKAGGVAAGTAAVVLGLWTIQFARADFVFDTARAESKYFVIGQIVRQIVEPDAVVLSRQHSGSIRYYSSRMTMNFAGLDEQWLDPAVLWLHARGVKTYAALEEFEIAGFRARFAGQSRLGHLAMPPSLVYSGPTTFYLYDLSRSEGPAETMQWPEVYGDLDCVPPEPKPALRLGPAGR